MKYYKRNIGDYAASTRHLSLLEHGAYNMFLDLYYTLEGPLPLDVAAALRAIGARSQDERQAAELVLREFFTETPEGWNHSACERVIDKYRIQAGIARENGTKGGRPPVSSHNPEITEIGSVSVPNPKAIHYPLTTSEDIGGLPSPRPKSRATKIPSDWTPNAKHAEIAAEVGVVSLDREADQFRDFHDAKGSTFLNWDAAFRTWLRNANKFSPTKSNTPQKLPGVERRYDY
jgi:uncharacterized protein YdaU (DUF1376 family)